MTSKNEQDRSTSRPLTVKDIARLSKTSPSTVSRVLTGIVPVAPEKREAILQAIASVNFRPNLVARSLKTKSTKSLGLIINDILNPFYGALARGIEDYATVDGYAVILCNTNENRDRELNAMLMLQDKLVDGIIMAPTGENFDVMNTLIKSGTPLVQLDRRLATLHASSVTVDNERGGYLATEHLLSAGHRRIAFITYGIHQMTVMQREWGYQKAMAKASAMIETVVCPVAFDLEDTASTIKQLFESPGRPTAMIAANNQIALAVLRVLKQMQVAVPSDLSFVVFDDLPVFDLMTPSLTAVSQPAYEMGRKAAEFLTEQIKAGNPNGDLRHELFQPTLIVRESSANRRL